MIINHNIAALNTHRQLSTNTANTNKNIEKLSSGLRINRAGDDAAGLAISEKMRGQIRGLDQATRNAQDGISLIQTAEGALNETHSILQRMRELSVQSSNDTNTTPDRQELQKEMNQLTSEINRIGNTTEFNTKKLLNGDLSEQKVVNAGTPTTTTVTLAAAQTAKVGDNPVTWSGTSPQANFNVSFTGKADNGLDWATLDKDTTDQKVVITKGTDGTFTVDIKAQDSTDKTIKVDADTVAYDMDTKTYSYNNNGISFSFTKEQADSWKGGDSVTVDLYKASGAVAATDGDKLVTNGAISTNSGITAVTTQTGTADSTLTDITVDGASKELLDGAAQVKVTWTGDKATVALLNAAGDKTLSTTDFSLKATDTLKYDANGIKFDFTVGAGATGSFAATVKLKMADAKTVTETVGRQTEDKSASFQIGANEHQSLSLGVNDMRASALGIVGSGAGFSSANNVTDGTNNTNAEKALDLTSSANAANAITIVDKAIATVSSERSKLGAVQNRLEHTINNLGTSSENLTAAESRIRDVDMAKEMMSQTKNNILAQAAQAMLAQANQQPQGVLQLLR